MPELNSPMHLNMLRLAKERKQPEKDGLYGLQWGDPNEVAFLKFIRDNYIYRFIHPDHVALEIGPGGGRWTRYLLSFRKVYAVDYHQLLLDELQLNFKVPHLIPVKNNGSDFPGVTPESVDFIFSFGTFVHLDLDIIIAYLESMKDIIKPDGNIVIQYSDKTKKIARDTTGFSENTPEIMRAEVEKAGFVVLDENLTILPHSSLIRFSKW